MMFKTKQVIRMMLTVVLSFVTVIPQQQVSPISASDAATTIAISSCTELQNIASDRTADYELTSDIDCSDSATWNGGLGFDPVGTYGSGFRGVFDGQGHVIHGLTISRTNSIYIGLFGYVDWQAEVKNVILDNINIVGYQYVGGLAGMNSGKIVSVTTSGNITGTLRWVGGLVGYNWGEIKSSSSEAKVYGEVASVGGLVGENQDTIYDSYTNGSVNGQGSTGGLVGYNRGTIGRSFSSSTVTGDNRVGGLVAINASGGTIHDSYAFGDVNGGPTSYVGGLLGWNTDDIDKPIVRNCYSYGKVTAGSFSDIGGLVGVNKNTSETISNSYWDTQTSGQTTSAGGTGKITAEMMQQATFLDWDFDETWRIAQGHTYPQLRWQPYLDLHVVGIGQGKVWHTMRTFQHPAGWEPFQDVELSAGEAGWLVTVAATSIENELHVVAGNANGRLWHTIRHEDGTWDPWLDVELYTGNMPTFDDLSAATVNGKLHLVGVGGGDLWHTIRHSSTNWDAFGNVENVIAEAGTFTCAAVASVNGNLHVVGGTSEGNLWHTIRFSSPPSWQGFGNVEAATGDKGTYQSVGAAGMGQNLHVTAVTTDGHLWHTIRFPTSWQSFYDVEAVAGDRGNIQVTAAASIEEQLHLPVSNAAGELWHTIRFPTRWQNFGYVEAAAGEVPSLSQLAAAHTKSWEIFRTFLPVVQQNAEMPLYIYLEANNISSGIIQDDGDDADTFLMVHKPMDSEQFYARCTGNGQVLPAANGNQVPDYYMEFNVDDSILYAEPTGTKVMVEITYFDRDTDCFSIQYDGRSGGPFNDGRFRQSDQACKAGTLDLTTVSLVLDEVYFANRDNGADFRIDDHGDGEERIRKVAVRLLH